MKMSEWLKQWCGVCACLAASFFLLGCETMDTGPLPPGPISPPPTDTTPLRAGDRIKVELTGTANLIPPHEELIKEDGTITLDYIGTVVAAGKTLRELEQEIHGKYVPTYYKRLTVTVTPTDRFYYVGGEVRAPNRQPYLGPVTVLKAIQSAGDFTDFADRKDVKVIRSSGQVQKVNAIKALKDPRLDLPIYPGDRIHVERRFW
jgi:protein involved in polysaccharide export with SLBB domain